MTGICQLSGLSQLHCLLVTPAPPGPDRMRRVRASPK